MRRDYTCTCSPRTTDLGLAPPPRHATGADRREIVTAGDTELRLATRLGHRIPAGVQQRGQQDQTRDEWRHGLTESMSLRGAAQRSNLAELL